MIKVALDSPEAARALAIDATMNRVARELGVRVPVLLAFDESRELLPLPYAIYGRVPDALPLDTVQRIGELAEGAWRDTGRNLALVHAVTFGTSLPLVLREFRQHPEVDPRLWVDHLAARARLHSADARWLHHLLDTLAPYALANIPLVLCHGDVNASNILLSPHAGSSITLIDWAGAGWLDPAWDFVGVPMAAVPHLLTGHREVSPLPNDGTAEARILWCQLQTRLLNARTEPDDAVARARLKAELEAVRVFATD